MQLCLCAQYIFGIKSGLDPQLCDVIAKIEVACLFYIPEPVFTTDYVLLSLTQGRHVVLILGFLSRVLGLAEENFGCREARSGHFSQVGERLAEARDLWVVMLVLSDRDCSEQG